MDLHKHITTLEYIDRYHQLPPLLPAEDKQLLEGMVSVDAGGRCSLTPEGESAVGYPIGEPTVQESALRIVSALLGAEVVAEHVTPQDIYDFYLLWWLHTNKPEALRTQFGEYVLGEYTHKLRDKYLRIFKGLLIEQLAKYASRKRVDADYDSVGVAPGASAELLWAKMQKTFRSDMQRRNDVWNTVGEYTAALEKAVAPDAIFVNLDRLNACVHNTNTLVLGKLSNGGNLMQAYETAANGNPEHWQKFASEDLRQLLDQTP